MLKVLLAFVLLLGTCAVIGRMRSGPASADDAAAAARSREAYAKLEDDTRRRAAARKACDRDPSMPIRTVLDDAATKHGREVAMKACIARRLAAE